MADHLHTQFAMKALNLADIFRIAFEQTRLPGEGVSYRVELSAPDGPSTGGGAQALQHVKLMPEAEGHSTLIAGTCNQAEGGAELRTYAFLQDQHAQRFKRATLPLDRVRYNALVKQLEAFFAGQQLRVVLVDAARRASSPSPAATSPMVVGILIFIVAALTAGGIAVALLQSRH